MISTKFKFFWLSLCIFYFSHVDSTIISYHKQASQSSIGWGGNPARAVDGNKNKNYGGGSCTHTQNQHGAWWQVNLGHRMQIYRVVIFNRHDCCWDRLSNFVVLVSKDGSHWQQCASYPGRTGRGQVIRLTCASPDAQFLRVQLRGKNYLTLCEVQVFGNPRPSVSRGTLLSKHKRCTQSSIGWGGDPNRATDGNVNQDYGGKSCTHTQHQRNAWWKVDLGQIEQVDHLLIYNRKDCCGKRLSNFNVQISNQEKSGFRVCGQHKGRTLNGQRINVHCKGRGRYVMVQLNGANYLTLCEVKVFGTHLKHPPTVNLHSVLLSQGKQTSQSSIGWGGLPIRAVDGNTNKHYGHKSCTHTNIEAGAWWQVDLETVMPIHYVKIFNRADCCGNRLANFVVKGSTLRNGPFQNCFHHPRPATNGQVLHLNCRLNARFITIALLGRNYLTLCEVQVFGLRKTAHLKNGHLLSRNKPTMESSMGSGGLPGRAVDGNENKHYSKASCTHTLLQAAPWWQVDLEQVQRIYRIVIHNRQDCCGERLSKFRILVSNSVDNNFKPIVTYNGATWSGQVLMFRCNIAARFVRIQLTGRNYLTLCEVQVFGDPKPAISLIDNKAVIISQGKVTKQVNTGYGGDSSKAIDGNKNTLYTGQSCTHTHSVHGAWWEVDLGGVTSINRVVIYNRKDCCGNRLSNFKILVSNHHGHGYRVCATYPGITWENQVIMLSCRANARFVQIKLVGKNYLTLCEVEVYGKRVHHGTLLSQGKPTSQSSIGWGGIPTRAVDGNSNQHYGHKSCTHTQSEQGAWWKVDLGQPQSITYLKIFNRKDCCGNRLSNFVVKTSNLRNGPFNQCVHFGGGTHNGQVMHITCKAHGQYVLIQLVRKNYLTLCEVQVFGNPRPVIHLPRGSLLSRKKTAMQSSLGHKGYPGLAVDGNKDQNFGHKSCSCSTNKPGNWWQVDLGRSQQIYRVVIANRKDCCGERLSQFHIKVSDHINSHFKSCITYHGATWAGQVLDLRCEGHVVGRYVRIEQIKRNYLTLCEVEVFGVKKPVPNVFDPHAVIISKGHATKQSSTGYGGNSHRANDGNTNQVYGGASCTHTNIQNGAWWEVDLGSVTQIDHVVIFNRKDCCGDRLSNFKIFISHHHGHGYKECAYYPGVTWVGQVIKQSCKGQGRFVHVKLLGRNYLTLCEVQVYGKAVYHGTLLSQGKPASQSSLGWGGIPTRAVDGNSNQHYRHKSCTHTQSEKGAWWKVDLGRPQTITYLKIFNRKDCCGNRLTNFHVKTSNLRNGPFRLCAQYGKTYNGQIIHLPCKAHGQYVMIQLVARNYLTLCEVQVFGHPTPVIRLPRGSLLSKKKTAMQSTFGHGGYPGFAVDGNKDQNFGHKSCACTTSSPGNWWQVDLTQSHKIYRVVIANRGDCCGERLSQFHIKVSNHVNSQFKSCITYFGATWTGQILDLRCEGHAVGRYVRIELIKKNILTLCEVQVFGAAKPAVTMFDPSAVIISKAHPTKQSSTIHTGNSHRANDGSTEQHYSRKSCTHTKRERGAWWEVDLGAVTGIDHVVIFNRKDCCGHRLTNFKIFTSHHHGHGYSECAYYPGATWAGQVIKLSCKARARFVQIKLMGIEYLTLCEVQVYGRATHSGVLLSNGKRTSQSSIGWSGIPPRAVDGNSNQIYGHKTCTHTKYELKPWWQVDLDQQQKIDHVIIYNRKDCCGERLTNFKIYLSNDPNSKFHECAHHTGRTGNGQILHVSCKGTGRFVTVMLQGKNYLTLCEVQVFGQKAPVPAIDPHIVLISRGKDAMQSSIGWHGIPPRAVDGNINQHYNGHSCTHTKHEAQPWWQVDLGAVHKIDHVVIYNRKDCCGERLSRFNILVSNDVAQGFKVCRAYRGETWSNQILKLDCPAVGRHLRIQLMHKNYLTLCEVQVFGYHVNIPPLDPTTVIISQGKAAKQVSVGWGGDPSRAVDGRTSGNWGDRTCTHTQSTHNAWWQVDLGRVTYVDRVVIFNRRDCCAERLTDFKVFVSHHDGHGYTECAHYPGATWPGQVIIVHCEHPGRFVKVQLMRRNYLTLCEVQVFGYFDEKSKLITKIGGNTKQISTGWKGDPDKGIDGKTSQKYDDKTCTHTKLENKPWWQVDMGHQYDMDHLVIYNRKDCCGERLSNFKVLLSNDGSSFKECGHYPGQTYNGQIIRVGCAGSGRIVRIQLQSKNYLTLCEVQIYASSGEPKIIIGKDDKLISQGKVTKGTGKPSPSVVIDGDESTCLKSRGTANPYWHIDLGSQHQIGTVVVYGKDLSRFEIHRTIYPGHWTKCASQTASVNKFVQLQCKGDARYIKISIQGNANLNLCEIKVYGVPIIIKTQINTVYVNAGPSHLLSHNLRAVGSSAAHVLFTPESAVDGSVNTMFKTNRQEASFWSIDLKKNHLIDLIVIKAGHMNQHLVHFVIMGGQNSQSLEICSRFMGKAGSRETLHMKCPVVARYIRIEQHRFHDYLQLPEVDIYGGVV